VKNFLTRLVIFFIPVLVAVFAMNFYLWNGYTPNRLARYARFEEHQLVQKYASFLRDDSTSNYNTLFFGTSRIYRHVNPAVFDSLTGTSSYNLGFSNLFPFRLYDMVDVVIDSKARKDVDVFIEIAPLAQIGGNYRVLPIQNSITFERLEIAFDYLRRYENKTYQSSGVWGRNVLAFAWKYFSFELIKNVLLGDTKTHPGWDKDGIDTKGFVPLDIENDQSYLSRRHPVDHPFTDVNPKDGNSVDADLFYQFMLQRLTRLKAIGVRNVYFILPPRTFKRDRLFLVTVRRQLEKDGFKVFDLSNPEKYGTLYSKEYAFDRSHLDSGGAKLLTIYLAQAFLEYKSQNKILVNN
jgi:hypothetical protein